MINQKLTFGEHIDFEVGKANRALGLLICLYKQAKMAYFKS